MLMDVAYLTYTESLRLAGQGFNPSWEQVARVKPWGTIYGLITLRGLGLGQPHCHFRTMTFCSEVCESVSLAYLISHNQHIYNLEY